MTEDKIDAIAHKQEIANNCANLSKTLDIHASPDLKEVPEFSTNYYKALKQRRRTVETIRSPYYIPDSKFVDGSKILQLAYLDKIIEDCDADKKKFKIKDVKKNLH